MKGWVFEAPGGGLTLATLARPARGRAVRPLPRRVYCRDGFRDALDAGLPLRWPPARSARRWEGAKPPLSAAGVDPNGRIIALSWRMCDALALSVDVALDAAAPVRLLAPFGPDFVLAAPLPRRSNPASPDSDPRYARLPLSGLKYAPAELRVVERPSLLDELAGEIAAADRADRDLTTPTVKILRLAADRSRGKSCSERVPGTIATRPGALLHVGARLAIFRRINAPEADARAADVEGVAIDDNRPADDGFCASRRRKAQGDRDRKAVKHRHRKFRLFTSSRSLRTSICRSGI